ncbi:DE-cadherin isoform X2 [Plodia interpunctella]|uniref:DE-cadherin isoform X2 n=1 Tax=Plodia interpunctella TaxID=58824 RepID=UPI002367EBB2|nr:DE-cadherin isoform X2 [Plodia interpunctella]
MKWCGGERGLIAWLIVAAVNAASAQYTKARDYTYPTHHVTRLRHSRHLPIYTSAYIPAPSPKLAVKDNRKPLFTECLNYRPTVKEEQPVGTYVFTVKAEDRDPPDMGGTVTYKFVSTPGEKERFNVDPVSGRITTADIFDHDEPSREKETYITVRASDNGQPPLDDACTIKILIEDINDNQPVFDKVSYSESVPQDLPSGREVMRISATDIDDGNNSIVHYSLDSNSPDQSYFYIDPDNGVIFLNKTIDKVPGYKFKLSAIVKDMGEVPQQSAITLDIQVVESNKKSPSFIEVPDEPIRLKENYADFKTPIATVRAVSNIPGEEKLQFELVMGQTEQTNKRHTFVLEPEANTAYIKLGNHLDYEKITDYTLTVRIQNNYKLAAETIIQIEVEDVNDNIPIFSEIRSGSVLENEPPGTPVMQVRAFDADGTSANNQITYQLGDPSDPFAIDSVTGNITTLKMFDREEKSFYNIKIIATDNSESALIPGKHNSGQQSFLIEIADKNDNPPHFTMDTYVAESIAENANINELVTQVTALDIDTASVVTYSIVAGNTYDAFVIRNFTGEIRVNNVLDYENITSYSLDVRAFDGLYEDYAKVKINIENLNDNPPVFLDSYNATIEEERLYDGCIVKVEAYDPDIKDRNAPQHIVYSLVRLEQKEFLQIDNDGCLMLTKPLDRDPPSGFATRQILIMAADHGGKLGSDSLRSPTEVILELTDINDNAPFLTNTQPVIWYENENPGQVVVLTAKDYDSEKNGAPFEFSLNESASLDIRSKFSIQGNILSALVTFDRELQKKYEIPVAITDSGTPRMTGVSILTVVIGDKNDNPMAPGHSNIFVYNYKTETFFNELYSWRYYGEAPDTEIGRVYVDDPDDWDLPDKRFMWIPSYELRSPYFDVHSKNGMITMKHGTPNGTYLLRFNVTEENEPKVPFHWVEATVNVTIKEIPEEAVDKSGSIRFVNITAEDFIIPEADGTSKKEKLHRRLSQLYNTSMDNVDVFTIFSKVTVKDNFLDVRFSAHGSPYYPPEKLDSMVIGIQEKLEEELQAKIYMVKIDECLIEKEQCADSCRNVLMKNNVPLSVYTNTTSFVGVSARVESECTCDVVDTLICLNGGTPIANQCECPEGLTGPHCEQTSIGFHGDGWAMYPSPPACHEGHVTMTVTSHSANSLVFYMGPLKYNPLLDVQDFMSLELVDGYPVLLVNYGSGTTRLNNSVVHVSDGKPHLIEIVLMRSSIEMFVDRCKLSTCMSLAAPTGPKEILNVNGPLQVGGSSIDLQHLARTFGWRHTPTNMPFVGCISNFTYNDFVYNLGEPSVHHNADPSCQRSMFTAVTFGIDTNFLVAILVCIAILVILLLAVVVHRRRADAWAEKELDDIRENIIAYEDEGGGEGDAGYDLHVLRQMYDGPPPDTDPSFMYAPGLKGAAPDISGFLDDKKSVLDRDPDINPYDDVRHYAYEGDGNTSGSLSSLASCTDDGDLKFNYLSTFGPRFRKLADMYGDSDDDRVPHEESWC